MQVYDFPFAVNFLKYLYPILGGCRARVVAANTRAVEQMATPDDWTLLDNEQEAANVDQHIADDLAEGNGVSGRLTGKRDCANGMVLNTDVVEDHQSSNTAAHDVHEKRLRACVEQLAISAPTRYVAESNAHSLTLVQHSKLEMASTVHGVGLVACCVMLALLVAALPLHAPPPLDAPHTISAELDSLHASLQQELSTNAALQAQLQDAHRAVHRARARADHLQQRLLAERRRADNLLGMLDAVHRAAHAQTDRMSCGADTNKHETLSQQLMVRRQQSMVQRQPHTNTTDGAHCSDGTGDCSTARRGQWWHGSNMLADHGRARAGAGQHVVHRGDAGPRHDAGATGWQHVDTPLTHLHWLLVFCAGCVHCCWLQIAALLAVSY